ncbi:MAG: J domain-containing protein [Leptolyngbyaceae cyanobacterium RM2_2_4]|nr:J domain-containing protein [Leptolyngbyaceae cyanobacterium SM1_4_3]NJN89974.1 J domain-containing protein [Leptolyngbyaceae cyanobacterium SL_5_14]NJO49001.1 J domain-containing protein [Leptolyngbyaceae cyanobacterium RM2_2_4]NJO66263.1 J domain-containing protein [Leptolyngbyaceae cyanobacterium RM1_405_57]
MQPKSLKVTFNLEVETVEEAVVDLSGRFLRSTKTGCRIVRQATDFSLAELCKSLIEDWKSGKVAYVKGEVTLVFSAGELDTEADLLVYSPEQGDRFLYSRRIASSTATSAQTVEPQVINTLSQHLQTVSDALAELAANQRSVESRMQDLAERVANSQPGLDVSAEVAPAVDISAIQEAIAQAFKPQTDLPKPVSVGEIREAIAQALKTQADLSKQQLQEAIAQAIKAQSDQFKQQLQVALDAQAAYFVKILSNQLNSTALHFSQRVDSLQNQLTELTAQVAELKTAGQAEFPPPPQTEAEWLKRFKETWGTVGDYEQYSSSHREANAETPLYYVPDWVALCELEWACKLNPTLARLQTLIYGESGIGYAGADILQQFGCHIDPQTGEHYYIYHQGGFSAYEALRQLVNNPQYSWLPELKRLWKGLGDRQHEIFRLFGWEQEAIAALEGIGDRTYQERQTYDPWNSQKKNRDTLSDYLTLLNLGPFTPITLESIKRAYKQAMKVAHPDAGGSKEQAQRVNEAYAAILAHYFPEAT